MDVDMSLPQQIDENQYEKAKNSMLLHAKPD